MAALFPALDMEPAPRSPEVAQQVAVRIHSGGKIVFVAILWFVGVAYTGAMAAALGLVALSRLAGVTHKSDKLETLLGFAVFALAHLLAWIVFARWVRGWRAAARALGRDGEMVDAVVAGFVTYRGGRWYEVELALAGQRFGARVALRGVYEAGHPVKVLARPGGRYLLVFDKPENDQSSIGRLRSR